MATTAEHKKPAPAAGKTNKIEKGVQRAAVADKKNGQGKQAEQKAQPQSIQRFDRMAVRAKLQVSEPGDAVEREADTVADKVMRKAEPTAGTEKKSQQPPSTAKTPEKIARATDQTKKPVQTTQGSPKPAEKTDIKRASQDTAPDVKPKVPADFGQKLGEGTPLDPQTRSFFEQRFGQDLSHVRIHNDAAADEAAKQIKARAFTYGSHIAFAAGHYQPESPEGQRLLAHEITHVLQQREDTVPRIVMRAGSSASAAADGEDFIVDHAELEVPPIKARHLGAYRALASAGNLKRKGAYDASTRGTKQVQLWTDGLKKPDINDIPAAQRPSGGAGYDLHLNMAGGAAAKVIKAGGKDELERLLKIPTWNASGGDIQFQVDHMVEYQLGGADDLANMELLNQAHNGSVGSSFSHGIKRTVREEIDTDPKKDVLKTYSGPKNAAGDPTAKGVMEAMTVVFKKVKGRARESRREEGGSEFWSRTQIEALDHVLPLLGSTAGLDGDATRFALLSPTGNLLIAALSHGNGTTNIPIGPNQSGGMAGFKMQNLTLVSGYNDQAAGANIGTLEGQFDFGPKVKMPQGKVSVAVSQAKSPGKHSGKVGTPTGDSLPNQVDFTPMSPLLLSDLSLGKGVFGKATLQPSHPALSGINIPATIQRGKLGIFYTLDATTLAGKLKIPGVKIDSAGITFGYDGTEFSVGGGTEFTIQKFGTGYLNAEADTSGDFSLEGGLHADKHLFDQADMKLWYRKKSGFGGSGTLGITTPGKIKGLKSAHLTAKYEDSVFSATGTVDPDIPGLKSASLGVTYGDDELQITGQLAIDDKVPGVEKANVTVRVKQVDAGWKVAAGGDVTPKLLGLDGAQLKFIYDDGFVLIEGGFAFKKGPLSGKVTAGVTNADVDDNGNITGSKEGSKEFRAFGNGTVNLRITDHLQGGVGLKLKPTGDILISGHIGIPGAVTVFDQYPPPGQDRRTLFSMPPVSIPLFGVPGVGVSLNISGGIEGYAHIGPGQLTEAELNVVDFNPAQPDSLHVTGRAAFDLPGAAGIDASLDAGVAAGALVSLEAGLGVRAGAGVEAHVRPSTDIDWTPSAGLHLHADLNASLTPKLKFDVHGYAKVMAGAFGVNWELWRKDWQLAQKEIGSSLSLVLNVPVDYYSDGRGVVFDPNKVSFQVPTLNADTLSQLLNENGQSKINEG